MPKKLLTSWSPIIRWLLLPIACILCPLISFILSIIYQQYFTVSADRFGYEATSFSDYWFNCIQAFIFGAGFVLPIIYLAPSHTKIVLNIAKTILLFLLSGLLIWIFNQDISLDFWDILKFIGIYLCICAGLFIDKFENIED